MRALSLWQPWASLLVRGRKRVETRSKGIPPGPLIVHAAKRWTPEQADVCREMMVAEALRAAGLTLPPPAQLGKAAFVNTSLPLGCIVGMVDVVDTMPTEDAVRLWSVYEDGAAERYAEEHALGDYTPGRAAILCDRARYLVNAIPCPGRQWLWNLPDDLARQVLVQSHPAPAGWRPDWRRTPTPGA